MLYVYNAHTAHRHMSSFASAAAPPSHSRHSPYHARRRHVGFFGLGAGLVDVGRTGGSVMVARSPCVGSLIMVDVLSWHPQITPGVRHVVLSLSVVELDVSSAHPKNRPGVMQVVVSNGVDVWMGSSSQPQNRPGVKQVVLDVVLVGIMTGHVRGKVVLGLV